MPLDRRISLKPVPPNPLAWLLTGALAPAPVPGRLTLSNFSYDGARVQAVITPYPDCQERAGTAISDFEIPLNGTRIIAAYLEGIGDAARLVRALEEARDRAKKIVLIKAGVTPASARAALAHTSEDRRAIRQPSGGALLLPSQLSTRLRPLWPA